MATTPHSSRNLSDVGKAAPMLSATSFRLTKYPARRSSLRLRLLVRNARLVLKRLRAPLATPPLARKSRSCRPRLLPLYGLRFRRAVPPGCHIVWLAFGCASHAAGRRRGGRGRHLHQRGLIPAANRLRPVARWRRRLFGSRTPTVRQPSHPRSNHAPNPLGQTG